MKKFGTTSTFDKIGTAVALTMAAAFIAFAIVAYINCDITSTITVDRPSVTVLNQLVK